MAEREERQPGPHRIPVDIDVWTAWQPGSERLLVACFRAEMRLQGKLMTKRTLDEWTRDFEAYRVRPTGPRR